MTSRFLPRPMGIELALVPFVNVVFLLLGFVLVFSGFAGRWWTSVDVKPVRESEIDLSSNPAVVMTAAGALFLNGWRVDWDGLRFGLKLSLAKVKEPILVASVEEGVPHGDVARLIRIAQEAGIKRVALASTGGSEAKR